MLRGQHVEFPDGSDQLNHVLALLSSMSGTPKAVPECPDQVRVHVDDCFVRDAESVKAASKRTPVLLPKPERPRMPLDRLCVNGGVVFLRFFFRKSAGSIIFSYLFSLRGSFTR